MWVVVVLAALIGFVSTLTTWVNRQALDTNSWTKLVPRRQHPAEGWLVRHTFVSLVVEAGALPAETDRHLGHVDGGVLVSRGYQHLFPDALEGAQHRLDRPIGEAGAGSVRDQPMPKAQKPLEIDLSNDGRTWDRTRDLSRVKRALSR